MEKDGIMTASSLTPAVKSVCNVILELSFLLGLPVSLVTNYFFYNFTHCFVCTCKYYFLPCCIQLCLIFLIKSQCEKAILTKLYPQDRKYCINTIQRNIFTQDVSDILSSWNNYHQKYYQPLQQRNGQHARLECGRSWVRTPIGSNQRLKN